MSITKTSLLAAVVLFAGLTGSVSAQSLTSPTQPQPHFTPLAPPVSLQHHRSTELGDALDAYANLLDANGRSQRLRSEAAATYQYAESMRLQNMIDRERAKLEIERQKLELQSLKYQRQELIRHQSEQAQARMKPTPVLAQNGQILWIEPLRHDVFTAYRRQLNDQVDNLLMATNLKERERANDAINQTCQDFVELIAAKPAGLSDNALDSSRRFVLRVYDDLQQPAASLASTKLTSR